MCSEAVLNYLQETNRPYSANDIVLNLHNAFSKNVIQKSLDELTEKGSIKEKIYGKQKIYCVIQTDADESNQEELSQLNNMINLRSQEAVQLEKELKPLEAKLKDLQSQPTTDQAEEAVQRLKVSNGMLKEKLKELTKNVPIITKEQWKKTEDKLNSLTKEKRTRERWLKDMTDLILENGTQTKSELYDEIGIDI